MSLQFVIDAYNIINHPQFIRKTSNKKFKDPKDTLLNLIRLNKLCGSLKNKITVVFDGFAGSFWREKEADIEIIFSQEESADERINKIVERSKNPKNIVVVSDDKEIRVLARYFGAKALGVDEFVNRENVPTFKQTQVTKPELTYSQMHKINQEFRKIWLE